MVVYILNSVFPHHSSLNQLSYSNMEITYSFRSCVSKKTRFNIILQSETRSPISSVSPLSIVVWFAIPTFIRSVSGSKPLETAYLNFCKKKTVSRRAKETEKDVP